MGPSALEPKRPDLTRFIRPTHKRTFKTHSEFQDMVVYSPPVGITLYLFFYININTLYLLFAQNIMNQTRYLLFISISWKHARSLDFIWGYITSITLKISPLPKDLSDNPWPCFDCVDGRKMLLLWLCICGYHCSLFTRPSHWANSGPGPAAFCVVEVTAAPLICGALRVKSGLRLSLGRPQQSAAWSSTLGLHRVFYSKHGSAHAE